MYRFFFFYEVSSNEFNFSPRQEVFFLISLESSLGNCSGSGSMRSPSRPTTGKLGMGRYCRRPGKSACQSQATVFRYKQTAFSPDTSLLPVAPGIRTCSEESKQRCRLTCPAKKSTKVRWRGNPQKTRCVLGARDGERDPQLTRSCNDLISRVLKNGQRCLRRLWRQGLKRLIVFLIDRK